jgi:hypothetical protein
MGNRSDPAVATRFLMIQRSGGDFVAYGQVKAAWNAARACSSWFRAACNRGVGVGRVFMPSLVYGAEVHPMASRKHG